MTFDESGLPFGRDSLSRGVSTGVVRMTTTERLIAAALRLHDTSADKAAVARAAAVATWPVLADGPVRWDFERARENFVAAVQDYQREQRTCPAVREQANHGRPLSTTTPPGAGGNDAQ